MKTVGKIFAGIACASIGFGVIILIICFGIGNGSMRDAVRFSGSYHSEVTDVVALDFDIEYGNLIFQTGDSFSVDAEGIYEEGFASEVTDGVWTIRQRYPDKYSLELYGWYMAFSNRGDREGDCRIVVTLPDDFNAERVSVEMDAGRLYIESIRAESMDLAMSFGGITVDGLLCTGRLLLGVDVGIIRLNDAVSANTILECDIGSIYASGLFAGKSDVTCDVGEISMTLDSRQKDYNYKVESDIGSVKFGNRYYNSFGGGYSYHGNMDSPCSMYIGNNIGSVTVDFRDNLIEENVE